MPPLPECAGAGDGDGGASSSDEGRDVRRAAGEGGGADLQLRRDAPRTRRAGSRGGEARPERPQGRLAYSRLPGDRDGPVRVQGGPLRPARGGGRPGGG